LLSPTVAAELAELIKIDLCSLLLATATAVLLPNLVASSINACEYVLVHVAEFTSDG
jgi:hypothetical protein